MPAGPPDTCRFSGAASACLPLRTPKRGAAGSRPSRWRVLFLQHGFRSEAPQGNRPPPLALVRIESRKHGGPPKSRSRHRDWSRPGTGAMIRPSGAGEFAYLLTLVADLIQPTCLCGFGGGGGDGYRRASASEGCDAAHWAEPASRPGPLTHEPIRCTTHTRACRAFGALTARLMVSTHERAPERNGGAGRGS